MAWWSDEKNGNGEYLYNNLSSLIPSEYRPNSFTPLDRIHLTVLPLLQFQPTHDLPADEVLAKFVNELGSICTHDLQISKLCFTVKSIICHSSGLALKARASESTFAFSRKFQGRIEALRNELRKQNLIGKPIQDGPSKLSLPENIFSSIYRKPNLTAVDGISVAKEIPLAMDESRLTWDFPKLRIVHSNRRFSNPLGLAASQIIPTRTLQD